jgi:SAM-dependent methyltransferase
MVIFQNRSIHVFGTVVLAFALGTALAAQQEATPFEPVVGQPGKDVVWVPTPEVMVEKMLDVAEVTPQDYVIDLGSGDGRNIIGAARRGVRGHGVEYNQDMVDLSKRNAAAAGVGDMATFIQGDMYEADIAKASVLALFLLPENLNRLRDKFLALRPGSRIVSNTFSIENWEPEYTETIPDCSAWCTVLLYIVPANAAGAWQLPQGMLTLEQQAVSLTGSLGATPIADGKVLADQITFTAGDARYTGRVNGDTIEGTVVAAGNETPWRATRARVASRE